MKEHGNKGGEGENKDCKSIMLLLCVCMYDSIGGIIDGCACKSGGVCIGA